MGHWISLAGLILACVSICLIELVYLRYRRVKEWELSHQPVTPRIQSQHFEHVTYETRYRSTPLPDEPANVVAMTGKPLTWREVNALLDRKVG